MYFSLGIFYNYWVSKLRVTVLMGGRGSEREISMISGREVVKNLNREKYEVSEMVLGDDLGVILKIKADVVFIAIHGKDGEDGLIQGMLDFLGILYTGSGVLASAMGLNKVSFRRVIDHLGVAIPRWRVYEEGMSVKFPCVVKPVDQGSSIGVSIVREEGDFDKAVKMAKKYSRDVIVEEYIKGMELSCGVLGNEKLKALPVIEIRPKNEFFDYEAKYNPKKCEEIVPAEISGKVEEEVRRWSTEIYKTVGCRGFARVDFIVKEGKPYVLEINTIPGLTPQSLLPKEAKAAGMSHGQLLDEIIRLAILP